MDPLMGLLGAALVARWAWGLLRDSGPLLLDHQAPAAIQRAVREAIEGVADNRLYDLHVWAVAPGAYAAVLGVVTHTPRSPEHYKALIPVGLGLVHATVEVQACGKAPAPRKRAA
jgi:Co/Zn/Cd efflux system component